MKHLSAWKKVCSALTAFLVMSAVVLPGCGTLGIGEPVYNENHPGEITYYETPEENIVQNDDNGMIYANNEILLSAAENASYQDIEALAEKYDAEIKGYIEVVGEYQLVLNKTKTEDELNEIIDELRKSELVEDASLSLFNEGGFDAKDADPTNDSRWKGEWEENYPDGENWGLEAIRCPSAWRVYGSANPTPVKVGIVDGGFFEQHEDLQNVYAEVFDNPSNRNDTGFLHGTHVSGTIGAEYNNGTGITGVYPSSAGRLYAAASALRSNEKLNNDNPYVSVFTEKCAFSKLIVKGARVINFSQHSVSHEAAYAATKKNEDAIRDIKGYSDIFSKFLRKFIDKSYDFLIVSSAGNCSGREYKTSSSVPAYNYGYLRTNNEDDTEVDAFYNSTLNAITDQAVMDRIVVVGAAKIKETGERFRTFERCSFSNTGERVGVMAPGYSITSTGISSSGGSDYVGGETWSGTSMAAPHVTGVAAMVWSVNNRLTGPQVKDILRKSANITVEKSARGMINAELAVREAGAANGQGTAQEKQEGALSVVVYENGKSRAVSGVTVDIYKADSDNKVESVTTDANGVGDVVLPEGDYDLTAAKDGFGGSAKKRVQILRCNTTFCDLPLYPAVTAFSIPDEMTLTVGHLDLIEPEVEPETNGGYSIRWSSSDESVVTVNPTGEYGTLTALKKGTATITAELTSGNKTLTETTSVRVASQGRDTVLVLDVSGSMRGTPLAELKKAAQQFCDDLLKDEYNNRVAIVCFNDSITLHDFSGNTDELKNYIAGIRENSTTNMSTALEKAEQLLDSSGSPDHIKNIVVMADGMPNMGKKSKSGSAGLAGNTSYSTAQFANGVVDTAQDIMQKYNMYSLGFFHSLSGTEYKNCSTLMSKLTNMPDGYHEVKKAEDLQFEFGDIATEISNGSKIIINIACPVDVTVSCDGERLCSSEENFSDKASFGRLEILGSDKDVKVLSLDSDRQYDVDLRGTGEGMMDYLVNYMNRDDEVEDFRNFSSVYITNKTIINSNTDNSRTVNLNVDTDGDGNVDIVYEADSKSTGKITVNNTETTAPPTEPATQPEQFPVNNSDEAILIIAIIAVILMVVIGLVVTLVAVASSGSKSEDLYEIPVLRSAQGDAPSVPKNYVFNPGQVQMGAPAPQPANIPAKASSRESEKPTSRAPVSAVKNSVESADALIEVLTGSKKGMRVPVSSGETVTLGKSPSVCQLVFDKSYRLVSRRHCTITFERGQGVFYVTDMSTNGTYRSGNIRLEKNKKTVVTGGTLLNLGNSQCVVRLVVRKK